MPKQYIDDLNNIYNEDIVLPTKPGPGAQELEQHGSEGSTGKVFDESYSVDFSESEYPEDWSKEKDRLTFMMENGLMSQKDLLRHFNKDISDSELEEKLSTIQEETPEPEAPASPLLSALRND